MNPVICTLAFADAADCFDWLNKMICIAKFGA
jgi:hypothetical protein